MTDNVNKFNTDTTSDNLGRTLSNILTSIPLPDFQLNNIDIFQQDLENGYTPFHQLLNNGYIYKAFLLNESYKKKQKKKHHSTNTLQNNNIANSNNITNSNNSSNTNNRNPWKIRDNDGLTPLELYMNKYFNDPVKLNKYIKNENTCKLYGFGKIINLDLGLGNNNDSLKEVDLNGLIINDIKMNNSRVIFIDNEQRLLMFKLKHIGEIIENNSLNTFIKEPYVGKYFLKSSISNTHTMATTDNNELVLFGDDEYGQCSMAPSSQNATGNILFISCSTISSSLINSKNQLISWGLNTGQFGNTEISCSNNTKINFNNTRSYLGKKFTVIDLPDTLGDVKQLIQLDYVTLILHGDNGLLVLSNFKKYHFYIPPLGTKEHSFNVKVSNRLTLGNKVMEIFVKDPFGNNILAKFENGILGHFHCNTKDNNNIWRSQLFQLPFKILYKPENNLLKNYQLAIGDSKDNLKCGLLNFFGDYSYLSFNKSNQFQHKNYYKLLQNPDTLIGDPDCNNFLIIKKDYDLKIEKVNNYKNLTQNWLNLEVENEKVLVQSLNKKNYNVEVSKYKLNNNFDLEIVDYKDNTIAKLHKFVLELLAPDNLLFNSELFKQVKTNKLKYLSENEDDISVLKDSVLYLYLGKMSNIDKVYKVLSNIFKIKELVQLSEKISNCLNKGSIELKTKYEESLFCEKDILMINSPVLYNLFQFNNECKILDFSNFEHKSILFLLKYFHLTDINFLLNADGKNLTFNNLLELICISDYLLLPDLKNYIEYLISCKYINSNTFVKLVTVSITYNCQHLFEKACEFLFLNVGVLFEDERLIQEIKDNFNFKIWDSIEKQIRLLMNIDIFDDSNCWYRKSNFRDLLKLFNTNLPKWNILFNDRFVIENKKKYATNNNNNNKRPSICLSRSGSISSQHQHIERPIFTNPWSSNSRKSSTPISMTDGFNNVFDDDDEEYSDVIDSKSEEINLDHNHPPRYRQGSYGSVSRESFDDLRNNNNSKEDDFIIISKNKRKSSNNKAIMNPPKSKERSPIPGLTTAKIIPGSQPLKVPGKRRASNHSIQRTSTTKIPASIIKSGPELPKVAPQLSNNTNNVVKKTNDIPKETVQLPSLPTLSSLSAKEPKNVLNSNHKSKTIANTKKTRTIVPKNSSNILSLKDKTNVKPVSNNMSLEDMISLAQRESKQKNDNINIWFQDKPIVSKTLAKKTNSNITITNSNTLISSSITNNKSKWDYTKQNYSSKETITLEEMMKNTKKR